MCFTNAHTALKSFQWALVATRRVGVVMACCHGHLLQRRIAQNCNLYYSKLDGGPDGFTILASLQLPACSPYFGGFCTPLIFPITKFPADECFLHHTRKLYENVKNFLSGAHLDLAIPWIHQRSFCGMRWRAIAHSDVSSVDYIRSLCGCRLGITLEFFRDSAVNSDDLILKHLARQISPLLPGTPSSPGWTAPHLQKPTSNSRHQRAAYKGMPQFTIYKQSSLLI
jgi:hypothetical protein